MNTILMILSAALAVLGVSAASADSLDVRAGFESVSASAIVAELPSNASDFSALAGQFNNVRLELRNRVVDATATSGSLVEVDGWRGNVGGFIGAGGFAGIRGFAEND